MDPELLQRRLSKWKDHLASPTEIQVPTDYPRPLPLKVVEAERVLDLPDPLCMKLLQLSLNLSQNFPLMEEQVTPFTILLAAFAVLIHRYTGERDIVVSTTGSSYNPIVLRLDIEGEHGFDEVASMVHRTEVEAIKDEVPFDMLIKSFSEAEMPNVSVLSRLRFFNLTESSSQTMASMASASDISIFISQVPTARRLLPIQVRVLYNTVLFSDDRIEQILSQLSRCLQVIVNDPECLVKDIDLVVADAKIPDPNLELVNWETDWPGSIPDIFMSNSFKHPDKLCVAEYRDNLPTRKFSYKQMNDGSSMIAQGLLKNKIQPEDVVVIYAHRGVELVAAIMGVLRAGATFSVIDPQYPPPRQKVYLQVAQPSGLIVLERAGKIIDEIDEYITSEQDFRLKCKILDLKLLDDGTLSSSNHELVAVQDAIKYPELGPDSIGTLSFTSGSTGLPKGVRGRHYSLTRFYPWMSAEFGLCEHDRFTMLSGIAHDPIQRDIFTPLFFGAEIHIPTSEDIGQPGRLAQWMANSKCTITHLTPAMGQLLSANAETSINDLKHAFFVGDILTKRDVVRLQSLAQNVTVVNMYGTTETQRAVSFFKIPNKPAFLTHQKEVLPAGKGMQGVQLVVINNNGKLCGVGEIGEIYVRSLGLAEGYLRKEEDTKKKFVVNFLNKTVPSVLDTEPSGRILNRGARDRMYKTGDLGRYRPDGIVECCGRADDQVKIRGFRIELGEIDTHLSQHPGVRENVTLVKRDAYEEKTLISYFVPHSTSEEQNMAELVKSIREFLKQKLPSYSVPSIIVPLARMPLTPNGKVDKNSLPFPDTVLSQTAENVEHAHTAMEKKLVGLWSAVLFPGSSRQVGVTDNFFDVGGHSIMATRLIFQVRRSFKLEGDSLPLNLLFQCPTIREMAGEIEKVAGFGMIDQKEVVVAGLAKEPKTEVDLSSELVLPDNIRPGAHQRLVYSMKDRYNSKGEFEPKAVFLTGVTGFLGAFILHWSLKMFSKSTVYCLVRASNEADGWKRICENMEAHELWIAGDEDSEAMKSRARVVVGDLAKPLLGMSDSQFDTLADSVDAVIHNGALVHWVYPYEKLKPANVDGTLEALKLCTSGSLLKPFLFVSSTSLLDTAYYTEKITSPVLESDDLEGSRVGLGSGYGQSKWVAEKLLMMARYRAVDPVDDGKAIGIPISIMRPGYILGDSYSGVCNTDDFLWRLVKGCLQLGQVPVIHNVINALPVDFVAKTCVEILKRGKTSAQKCVFHAWNEQRVRFVDFFASLVHFGFGDASSLPFRPYLEWRDALMELTLSGNDNALYPLLHFVLDDLPTATNSPALDNRNMQWALDGTGVVNPRLAAKDTDPEHVFENTLMHKYLSYLCSIGFLPTPENKRNIIKPVAVQKRTGRSGH